MHLYIQSLKSPSSQVLIWHQQSHSKSAYDFPGPTPVPALLSRPFLEACYHSALTTSATAPASTPVTGDCSPAPSLRSSYTLGNKAIAYIPSRSTAVRCGALGNGSTTCRVLQYSQVFESCLLSRFRRLCVPFSVLRSLLSTLRSSLSVLCSLLSALYSLLSTLCSLLSADRSRSPLLRVFGTSWIAARSAHLELSLISSIESDRSCSDVPPLHLR